MIYKYLYIPPLILLENPSILSTELHANPVIKACGVFVLIPKYKLERYVPHKSGDSYLVI